MTAILSVKHFLNSTKLRVDCYIQYDIGLMPYLQQGKRYKM